MTLHPLHAGDGYEYLTSQVASSDRVRDRTRDLTAYYTETGTPPGRWLGHGATRLGISGEVTEAQMAALFGEGLHPEADAIIAAQLQAGKTVKQAIDAAKLGSAFYRYTATSSPITARWQAGIVEFTHRHRRRPTHDERQQLLTDAARTHLAGRLRRPATRAEIDTALAAERNNSRKAVAGFDCVFTPPKSVSILWGLADDATREQIRRCHDKAVRETLEYAEQRYAVTRRGRNGVRQIDADGLIIAAFDHFDNRNGDPNLHTHATISTKVRGSDGKWTALDARPLFASGVTLSCRYNATIVGALRRRLGFRFTPRDMGRGKDPVLEVDGVPRQWIDAFSRRPDILARLEQLTRDYRDRHGRTPTVKAKIALAQQATLATRGHKPVPRSLHQMLAEWNAKATGLLGDGRTGRDFVADLLAAHRDTDPPHDTRGVYEPDTIAAQVAEKVAQRRPTWTEDNIRSAAETRLAECDFATDREHRDAVEHIVALVRDRHSLRITPVEHVPAALARADGESLFTVTGSTRYTSTAVLADENYLLDATRTPTGRQLPRAAVDHSTATVERQDHVTLNPGQRALAQHLCTNGALLAVAIGPAGAGKTTAMKAVTAAWHDAGGTVLPLAPSQSAARQLGDDIGLRGHTIDRILTLHQHGRPTGIAPGTLVLVDEAAMTATTDLAQLVRIADEHDAVVRCIGDPRQLSAVEAGGMLPTLAAATHAPELTTIVRFTDPDETAASKAVRHGHLTTAWDFYRHRVTTGLAHDLRDRILENHLADTNSGVTSLMMAATLDDVAALNAAAQTHHAATGRVDTTRPGAPLSDEHAGHPGDTVITRRNTNRIRISRGPRHGTSVDNGDLWTITRTHTDGSLTLTGANHPGTVRLPSDYVRAHVELGYATTVHRAQGTTVQRAHLLLNATLGRALAYVGLTRGAESNQLYLATDALIEPDPEHQPDDPFTPKAMFAKVLAREDENVSATDTIHELNAQHADPKRLDRVYRHAVGLLARDRARYLLEQALPEHVYRAVQQSPHLPTLLDMIAEAHASRYHCDDVIAALPSSLPTRGDVGAVLARHAAAFLRNDSRDSAADTTGNPASSSRPAVPAPHPGYDRELHAYAQQLRSISDPNPAPASVRRTRVGVAPGHKSNRIQGTPAARRSRRL